MEKRIGKGTEVLIFRYVGLMGDNQDNYHFKRGKIESCMEIDELTATRDVPKKRYFYTVLGDDGIRYRGNYGIGNIGSSFFRTETDYLKFLQEEINRKQEAQALLRDQIDCLLGVREKLLDNIAKKEENQPKSK